MGRIFVETIEGRSFSCRCCGAQLARQDELLSKQFHSKNGPAWLFQSCVNVLPGPPEERLMTTGMHVVADIACAKCLNVCGWKYEAAAEESQKYKEGKFILERIHVIESDSNSNLSPPRYRPLTHPMMMVPQAGGVAVVGAVVGAGPQQQQQPRRRSVADPTTTSDSDSY